VKFGALALDYDGTIATDGVFDAGVRGAVGEVRERGVTVLLVTGRRLSDLQRAAGDLTCFDAVVAENGAVVFFPSSGRHSVSGHPPSAAFLEALRVQGIPFEVGETIVETDASHTRVVLDILRRMELPLVLSYNRSRLMVTPPAVAKSIGLRQALTALRVSIHNTVAIGDAENDHDLLDACEVGVAVGWGSPALRSVADEVIEGTGPAAAASYIRGLAIRSRLSATQMGRRKLFLGHDHLGQRVDLAVRGRTILIAGEPGTGKSWLAGLICEQLILHGYCVTVIDPEGDYRSLVSLPSVVVLGGEDPPPGARELARTLRYPDVSVVVDLSKLSHRDKVDYLRGLLPHLSALRRRTGLPHKIVIDEAHYYLHSPDSAALIDAELAGYVVVTYRISGLAPAVRELCGGVVLVTRETDRAEASALLDLCAPKPTHLASAATLARLAVNEAALLPGSDESQGTVRRFALAPRLTTHVRHRVKYLDMPVPETQAFVFTENRRAGARVRTLKDFMGLLESLPTASIEGHLARHDFSRWIGDVFRDQPLAVHIHAVESREGSEDVGDIAADIAQAIRARYDTAAAV
jgi:hydroxymethylpyrimidine pyrophosphatase-like HAD family hydrolase